MIQPGQKTLNLASAVLVLGSIVAMILLAIQRGPWLDEFFTIWMSDPAMALGRAYRERWATDLHPSMYYASVWALRQVVADDLTVLRLANAFPLLVVVPTFLAWHARRPNDPWGPVFAGLVCSCPYFISYFAELRSYFDVMAVTAALTVQLRLLRWRDDDFALGDWRFGLLVAGTIVWALNLHFIASAIVAILVGMEILRLAKVRHWRSAALLTASSAIGMLILVASLAYLLTKTQPFSLYPGSPLTYLKVIATGVALGFGLNVGVDLALLSALPAFWKRPSFGSRGAGWSAAGLFLAAAFLFVEGLFGNSLTLRYTLVLIPPAAALAAELACERLAESRLRIALFFLGGLALQIAVIAHEFTNKRWLAMAGPIAAAVRDCPDTRVIGIDHYKLLPPSERVSVAGSAEVFPLGYRWVSARYHFGVAMTQDDADTIVVPGPCPTLVWSAHDLGRLPDPIELMRQARIRFAGYDPHVMRDSRQGDQRLIVISAGPSK